MEENKPLKMLLPNSPLLLLMPPPSSEALDGKGATSCQPGPAGYSGPLFFLVSVLWEKRLHTQQN